MWAMYKEVADYYADGVSRCFLPWSRMLTCSSTFPMMVVSQLPRAWTLLTSSFRTLRRRQLGQPHASHVA